MYLISFMVGPEFYGFPIGKRCTKNEEWIITYKSKKGWPVYNLPPPAGSKCHISFKTCLICLSQFLVADIHRIAAANRKGVAWGVPSLFAGSLTVTTQENGDLLKLTALHSAQEALRLEFAKQTEVLGLMARLFLSPVQLIPIAGPKRGEMFRVFDPDNCPCGSADTQPKQHQRSARHKEWLDGLASDDEYEDVATVAEMACGRFW
jgi:hypothetical protein